MSSYLLCLYSLGYSLKLISLNELDFNKTSYHMQIKANKSISLILWTYNTAQSIPTPIIIKELSKIAPLFLLI